MEMQLSTFVLRIGLAIVAGLAIGFEREYKQKNAGLKTNTLVSLGAAVFVIVSLEIAEPEYTDITRVLGQVVTGIGFLGAGTIVKYGKNIKGLTTAATIWCSAGAGCLAAVGFYWELLVLSIAVILVNILFGFMEHRLFDDKGFDG